MKLPITDRFRNGYYDERGHWQRTKFCVVSCGNHCDCSPPMGIYYDARFDKSIKEQWQEDDRTD